MSNTDERALAALDTSPRALASGSMAQMLATMSEQEFTDRLAALKRSQERMKKIQLELMEAGVDYGLIPGTGNKPTLLKPGSETLLQFYQLVPTFETNLERGDGTTAPKLCYHVKCHLHLGTAEGPVVGWGEGAANSSEKKYRYRTAERTCPACGAIGTVKKSKFKPEWYCHAKAGGCGATFPETDPRIVNQQRGMVENPDPDDVDNTLLKMAEKRSQIDAALRATATSGLFTQDVEDTDIGGAAPPAEPSMDFDQSSAARPAPKESPERREATQAATAQPTPATDAPASPELTLARMTQEIRGGDELHWADKTKVSNLTATIKLLETKGSMSEETGRALFCALQWGLDGESHTLADVTAEIDCRILAYINTHADCIKDFKAIAEWWRLNRAAS